MSNKSLNPSISFFVLTQKGYESLKSFIETFGSDSVALVVSEKDKNLENDFYLDIEALSKLNKIPFYNRKDTYEILSDYTFAISWKWILSDVKNLIIFHDSLLPKYRGFAPLVNALINGEKEIGVTAFFAKEQYDTGDIILQAQIAINYPIKINKAIEEISKCYTSLVLDISRIIFLERCIYSKPQDEIRATYSLWRDEEDYFIDWTQNSEQIKRFIDSVGQPFKGAASIVEGRIVRIWDSEIITDVKIENRVSGKVIFINDGNPIIVCGKGLLMIKSMFDDKSKQNLLPLKKIKLKFT